MFLLREIILVFTVFRHNYLACWYKADELAVRGFFHAADIGKKHMNLEDSKYSCCRTPFSCSWGINYLSSCLCADKPTKPVYGRYSLSQSSQGVLKLTLLGWKTEKTKCCNEEAEFCALLFPFSSVISVILKVLQVQIKAHSKIQAWVTQEQIYCFIWILNRSFSFLSAEFSF